MFTHIKDNNQRMFTMVNNLLEANFKITMLALCTMTLASGCGVDEGSISKKPFAAVYKVSTQGEPTQQDHVFYDGNGHVRSQTIAPYSDNFIILDFRRNEANGIMESRKQYLHVSGLQGSQVCIFYVYRTPNVS